MALPIETEHHSMQAKLITFLGAFLTLVSSRMSSKRNKYMSTAFDISTKKRTKMADKMK